MAARRVAAARRARHGEKEREEAAHARHVYRTGFRTSSHLLSSRDEGFAPRRRHRVARVLDRPVPHCGRCCPASDSADVGVGSDGAGSDRSDQRSGWRRCGVDVPAHRDRWRVLRVRVPQHLLRDRRQRDVHHPSVVLGRRRPRVPDGCGLRQFDRNAGLLRARCRPARRVPGEARHDGRHRVHDRDGVCNDRQWPRGISNLQRGHRLCRRPLRASSNRSGEPRRLPLKLEMRI